MITKATLEAQLQIYQGIQARAVGELEKAKANLAASRGAIEATQNFMRLSAELEEAEAEKKKPEKQEA